MTDMSRTDSTQAMKNILSAYGDEEVADEEEEVRKEEEAVVEEEEEAEYHSDNPDYDISNSEDDEPKAAPVVTPIKRVVEDASSQDNTPKKLKTSRAPATKLVSYGGDEVEDDDAEDEDEESDSEKFINYDDSLLEETKEAGANAANGVHHPLVELPPEPTERCSNKLQVKILKLYQKMQNGMDLNASIQRRKDFRNPNIYEKLISYCNIDEKGTNYPPELYDPSIWGKESFYDELAKAQKIEMDKREKERKERTKVEFVTGTKKQTSDGTVIEHKRKSKWDSQPSAAVSKPIIITTNIINPPVVTITTSASGVKTAIISATGALKKPK